MSFKVTVIDYGMGNILSVLNAIHFLGYQSNLTSSAEEVANSEVLVLPGVGSFRKAMASLHKLGLDDAIKEAVLNREKKILGICLGMQLLAESSEEDGLTEGLGLIEGRVERFAESQVSGHKIPHVGFDQVWSDQESRLLRDMGDRSDFYFVHSYRISQANKIGVNIMCNYGNDFLAAYENKNIFATQFHPEKSQTNGLKLLTNFLNVI